MNIFIKRKICVVVVWIVLLFMDLVIVFFAAKNKNALFLSLGLLLGSAPIVYWLYHPFRKNKWRLAFFAFLFIFGYWNYHQYCNENGDNVPPVTKYDTGDILKISNMTTCVFFPSRGNYENKFQKEKDPEPACARTHTKEAADTTGMKNDSESAVREQSSSSAKFWEWNLRTRVHLFHYLVYLYIAGMLFSFFGRELVNKIRVDILRWFCKKNLNIFWEFSPQALCLAEDIIRESANAKVLFILPAEENMLPREENKSLINLLETKGMLWLCADFSNLPKKEKLGAKHFFLSNNCINNVKQANSLAINLRAENLQKPSFFIRLDESVKDSVLNEWIEQIKTKANVHIVSEQSIAADLFTVQYPMLDCPGIEINTDTALVSGKFSTLLLGFGWQGNELLKTIIPGTQFKGAEVCVDIVDCDPCKLQHFSKYCPEAVKDYNLTFYKMDVTDIEFENWLSKNIENYNRIIICFGSDSLNIQTAELFGKLYKEKAKSLPNDLLFARIRNQELYDIYRKIDLPFHIFGSIESIYKYEVIVAEKLDYVAKRLNATWVGRDADIEKEWRKSSYFNQESSRASAYGQRNILKLLGFELTSHIGEAVSAEEISRHIEKRLLVLAENEHMRWNAFHLLRGIHPWDLSNPPLETVPKKKCNQIDYCNRHAAIVDFSKLPEIDYMVTRAAYGEAASNLSVTNFTGDSEVKLPGIEKPIVALQAYDMRFVRNIPVFYKNAGIDIFTSAKSKA